MRVVQQGALRLRLEPTDALLGWQLLHSEPGLVHLEASGPVLHGALIGRRRDPAGSEQNPRFVLSTYVTYRHPVARPLWALTAPLHRTVARLLLRRAARADRFGTTTTP